MRGRRLAAGLGPAYGYSPTLEPTYRYSPTIGEIRTRLAEGTLVDGLPPGTSLDEFLTDAAKAWRCELAERLGFPVSRIAACEVSDGGLERKLAIRVTFDPPLSKSEDRRFCEVTAQICADSGTRPPILAEQA